MVWGLIKGFDIIVIIGAWIGKGGSFRSLYSEIDKKRYRGFGMASLCGLWSVN